MGNVGGASWRPCQNIYLTHAVWGASWRPLQFLLLFLLSLPCFAARVEIREGRFYVDNEPFYVRGIGYAPWRPHQHPGISYTDTNRRWTQLDFERMKAAHFNTIRTWDALDPEELALANQNGLMVLQGIWLDPKQDFSDPHNQQAAIDQVQAVAEKSKTFDNVLGYLIMTEPNPEAVLDTGTEETMQYFRRLKRAIQSVDPRPVSMDSWPPLAFMDYHDFDFVTFNLFAFWPKSIIHAMGLAGMTRWMADHVAADKPLIIGETGGYAVSEASQTAAGGFGGLTEYSQSLKDLESLRAVLEGHAFGSVLVSWIDTWHYPRDPDTHDNEPWEWDGVLAIPTDSEKDEVGIPRQIYKDVSTYNQLIPVEPKTNHIYPIAQPVPIQVNAPDDVIHVRYTVNDGDWKYLDGSGHGWFQGFFKLPKLAKKRQTMNFQALDKDETVLATKEVSFLAGVLEESVTIEIKGTGRGAKALEFSVKLEDSLHHPLTQRKVYYGCFFPISFGEARGTLTTNDSGQGTFTCQTTPEPHDRYIFVAAGTDRPEHVRTSDLRIFKLGHTTP